MRTPPSRLARRLCALIQARTRWLLCQQGAAMSVNDDKAAFEQAIAKDRAAPP
jgi:hypothetical protein